MITTILEKLISEYYQIEGNECGGNLHITLDDGNVDDDNITFCYGECIKNNDEKGLIICALFFMMTEVDRKVFYYNDFKVHSPK